MIHVDSVASLRLRSPSRKLGRLRVALSSDSVEEYTPRRFPPSRDSYLSRHARIYDACCRADDYTVTPRQSGYRALLVARVILGKPYPLKVTTSNLTGPPKGYNSVC